MSDAPLPLYRRSATTPPRRRRFASAPLELLRRYDKPGPRYTSYPTAVEFHDGFGEAAVPERLADAAQRRTTRSRSTSTCRSAASACSFCGCMVDHHQEARGRGAVSRLPRTRDRHARRAPSAGRRQVVQYHWGGGTPTYLSLAADGSPARGRGARTSTSQPGAEVAIEVDPRVTSTEQLALLRQLGFNRLSFGVQDFTPEVQEAVNRIQPEDADATALRRRAAARVRVDQHRPDLRPAAADARVVRPHASTPSSRCGPIAWPSYSYAHVPWIRGNQKRIDPGDLPTGERKLELFGEVMERFLAAGYVQIGMDHFALPDDELARASAARPAPPQLHGLHDASGDRHGGRSACRRSATSPARSRRTPRSSPPTTPRSRPGAFPIERGYLLDPDDRLRRARSSPS